MIEYKIQRLIEENLIDWAKNNKLAAGLATGAAGLGAYGLSQYLGADNHYLDSSGDNAKAHLDYKQKIVDLDRKYEPNLNWRSNLISQREEDLEKINAQKIEPSNIFNTRAEQYGRAAEAYNALQNPTSVYDLRQQELDAAEVTPARKFPDLEYNELADIRNSLVDSYNNGTISDADKIKFDTMDAEMKRQIAEVDTINDKYAKMDAYRNTPEYKANLEKELRDAQRKLSTDQYRFDRENDKFAKRLLNHNSLSERYQKNLDNSRNYYNKNLDFIQDKKDTINTNYSETIDNNNERMAVGKRLQADDLRNAKIAGILGTGAATGAVLANRNKNKGN